MDLKDHFVEVRGMKVEGKEQREERKREG